MNNGNMPAHPCEVTTDGLGTQMSENTGMSPGLTKREYFAAMAMQGLLANPEVYKIASQYAGSDEAIMKIYTTAAIEHADSLLKQLEHGN